MTPLKKTIATAWVAASCLGLVQAQPLAVAPQAERDPYQLADWRQDVRATAWETGGLFAGATLLGLNSWNWGSSNHFKVNDEGWFGDDTGSGGSDKLGHAFISYAITNVLSDRLVRQNVAPERAALSAFLTTQALMTYVEVFDGYSDDHGFSKEDMAMNVLGSGLAYARALRPGLRDTLDFRLEYERSKNKDFRPISDYEGQTYLVALKLGGFDALRSTPLRFFELHTGYYSRGFSKVARENGVVRRRENFVGFGVNLNELLFGQRQAAESEARNNGRLFFEHIQIPGLSVRNDGDR